MKKFLEVVRRPWVWRAALGLYVLCLCGVIFAYFVVSAMQVPTALYLHGPSEVELGQAVALRGHLLDAQNGQKIGHIHDISLSLEREGERIALAPPKVHRSGEMIGQIEPPSDTTPGDYELVLRAHRVADDPEFIARAPVRLVSAPPRAKRLGASPDLLTWPAQTQRRPKRDVGVPRTGTLTSEGEVSIELVQAHAVLGNGLPGTLMLRTTLRATGEPLGCDVTFVTSKGLVEGEPLPGSVRTGGLGLTALKFVPITLHQWELEAECEHKEQGVRVRHKGSSRLQVDVATTQLELTAINPTPDVGDELEANLTTIHREGAALVDLYRGDTWLWAGTFGFRAYQGGVRGPTVTQPGLYRMQAHGDIYDAGFAWDSGYFLVPGKPSGANQDALEQAIDELLRVHLEHTQDEERKRPLAWLIKHDVESWRGASTREKRGLRDALMMALPVMYTDGEPLINSFDEDQRELDAWKQGVRGELLALVGAALIVGLALLALVVLWGIDQAQRRQRLYDELSEEIDGDESEETLAKRARQQRAARLMLWVQGGVLCGTLVVFAACIWMLMRYMM